VDGVVSGCARVSDNTDDDSCTPGRCTPIACHNLQRVGVDCYYS